MAFRDRGTAIEGRAGRPDGSAAPATHRDAPSRVFSIAHGPTRPFAVRADRALLVRVQAELALAGQGRRVPRRLARVPADAIVSVGSKGPLMLSAPARTVPALAPPSRDATSATPAPPSRIPAGKAAYWLREAVLLAIFAATLAATYHLGRADAYHNVIIVPEPWSRHSRLS